METACEAISIVPALEAFHFLPVPSATNRHEALCDMEMCNV
jgi:hypothetical protein